MRSKILALAAAIGTTAATMAGPAIAQDYYDSYYGHSPYSGPGNFASGLGAAVDTTAAPMTAPAWAPAYSGYYAGYHPGYAYMPSYGYGGAAPYHYGSDYYAAVAEYNGYAPDYGYSPGYGSRLARAYAEGYDAGVAVTEGRDNAYCARKYRSYDPASGTYLGFDGVRHGCR